MSDRLSKIFAKNKDFPWQTMNNETIIVDPKGQSSFELNEVGTFIWKNLDGKNSIHQIADLLCGEYDVSSEAVTADLVSVVDELERNSLIIEAI